MATILAKACYSEILHEHQSCPCQGVMPGEYSPPQSGCRFFRRRSTKRYSYYRLQASSPLQELSPITTQIDVIALHILGYGVAIKELLCGMVVYQPVWLRKIRQATDGEAAVRTFKTFDVNLQDLAPGIRTTTLIVVQVRQNVEPSAPRAGFRRSHTSMSHLLNIFFNRLPVHLHYHLHAAGE